MALELMHIERMLARRAPFEEIIAALDELLARPDADELRASIAHTRVSTYCSYRRPAEECAEMLAHYLAIESDPVLRADTVWLVCSTIPRLRSRFLQAQIEELAAEGPDKRVVERLARLRELAEAPG